MKKYNADIYDLVAASNLRLWWVAQELGMHDSNFSKMLRTPLKSEMREKILAVIEKLKKEAEKNG